MSVSVESAASIAARSEMVPGVAEFGVRAFTTTREVGSFGTQSDEPVREVMGRWSALRTELRNGAEHERFATASQVHGATVLLHEPGWFGWLRGEAADGHATTERATGIAVTVADCVPIFIAHPSGAIAVLHSGWRGTAAHIVECGIALLASHGCKPRDLRLHAGPAICGNCYEVSGDVYAQLTGANPGVPTPIDLRALIADHAYAAGVRDITVSPFCTRCDNERFYSYRAGDDGRQLAVMIADA